MATKQFIGGGKAHQQFDSVTVTLSVDKALAFAYKREHGTFITFVVSRRQKPDDYGRTHSAFVLVNEPEQKEQPVEAPAPTRRRKKSNLSQEA